MSNSFFYFSMAIGVALGSWGAYLAEKKNRSRQLGFLLCPQEGDGNCDNIVNLTDLTLVINNWL